MSNLYESKFMQKVKSIGENVRVTKRSQQYLPV